MKTLQKFHLKMLLNEDFFEFIWLILPVITIVGPIISFGSAPSQVLDGNSGIILREYAFTNILWGAIIISAFKVMTYTERDAKREEWLLAGQVKWINLWTNYIIGISINTAVYLLSCWTMITLAAVILGGAAELPKQIIWIPNMFLPFGAVICTVGAGSLIHRLTYSGKVAGACVIVSGIIGAYTRFTSEKAGNMVPFFEKTVEGMVSILVPHIEWAETLAFIRNYGTEGLNNTIWIWTTCQFIGQGLILLLVASLLPQFKNSPEVRFKTIAHKKK